MSEKNLPTLYSLTAIGIATVLGSALAGGYMMYANYRVLGQTRPGIVVFLVSLALVTTSLLIALSAEPNPTLGIILPLIQVVLMILIAQLAQGKMFRSFEEMGGHYHPLWHTLVVAICASAAFVIIGTLFFGEALMSRANGT